MKKSPLLLIIGFLFFMFSCENEDLNMPEKQTTNVSLNLENEYSVELLEKMLETGRVIIPVNDNLTIISESLKKVENITVEGIDPFFKNRKSYVDTELELSLSYNEEELFLNYSDDKYDYTLSYSIKEQRRNNINGLKESKGLHNFINKEHFSMAITKEDAKTYDGSFSEEDHSHCDTEDSYNNNKKEIEAKNEFFEAQQWRFVMLYKSNLSDKTFKTNYNKAYNYLLKRYVGFTKKIVFKFKKLDKDLTGATSFDTKDNVLYQIRDNNYEAKNTVYTFLRNGYLKQGKKRKYGKATIGREYGYRYSWSDVSKYKSTLGHEIGHCLGARHTKRFYKMKSGKSYPTIMYPNPIKKPLQKFRGRNRKTLINTFKNEN